jgi:hypothetical protein
MENTVSLAQGFYFFVTGVWPIISMNTFLRITGPKTDLWLVKTVGVILAVIGATLLYAGFTDNVNGPVVLLGLGSALSLTFIEFVYVFKRVISPIYLVDAFAEVILMLWWALALWLA